MSALIAEYSAYTTLAMWLLYLVGIQYFRGGLWRVLAPFTITAYLLDVVLNYTLFAVLTWDYPKAGERTFSTRLNRLVNDKNWRGLLARWIAKWLLDWADPRGQHIYPKPISLV